MSDIPTFNNYQSRNLAQIHKSFITNIRSDTPIKLNGSNYPAAQNLATFPENISPKESKYHDFAYKTGLIATAGQVLGGLAMMGAGLVSKNKSPKLKANLMKTAGASLATSYLVSVPSCIGASIKSKQPSIFLTSMIWGALAPAMAIGTLRSAGDFPQRVLGFHEFSYVPSFAGFVNKINNEFSPGDNSRERKHDISHLVESKTYSDFLKLGKEGKTAREKVFSSMKFIVDDHINAVKIAAKTIKETPGQLVNYLQKKSDKRPDIFTLKPTPETMGLATSLVLAASTGRMLLGEKAPKFIVNLLEKAKTPKFVTSFLKKYKTPEPVKRLLDWTVGAGMVFDSLGMASLAWAENDNRKWPVAIGSVLRIMGDCAHSNDFMNGLRNFGGSSFEYYYAEMNREQLGSRKGS